jgi:hypothetical protein
MRTTSAGLPFADVAVVRELAARVASRGAGLTTQPLPRATAILEAP